MRKSLPALLTLFVLISCKPATTTTSTGTAPTTATMTATTATTITNPPLVQRPPLDHYKFWSVRESEPLNKPVWLKGQFDKAPWEASVGNVAYIANPVDKEAKGQPPNHINNAALHYVAYHITPRDKRPAPPPIKVTNQFGKERPWTLGAPELLLVPAAKSLQSPPEKEEPGDHFVCYLALNHQQAQIEVKLHDQFDDAMDRRIETIRDFPPAYFCVPVSKKIDDKPTEEIVDERTHLAIYRIAPPMKFNRPVWTKDQLKSWKLEVIQSELLGVPSEKQLGK